MRELSKTHNGHWLVLFRSREGFERDLNINKNVFHNRSKINSYTINSAKHILL